MRKLLLLAAVIFSLVAVDSALAQREASPRGQASTQIGPEFDKWITVDYGRPILRGRDVYYAVGAGDAILSGADVWRVGANSSTRFSTEAPLMFGENILPAGEYSMFVEMGETAWTLIFSNHKAKSNFRSDEEGIWGAYGYDSAKDELRSPMMIETIDVSMDQFTIAFFNVTTGGGQMGLIWENTLAIVPFSTVSVAD